MKKLLQHEVQFRMYHLRPLKEAFTIHSIGLWKPRIKTRFILSLSRLCTIHILRNEFYFQILAFIFENQTDCCPIKYVGTTSRGKQQPGQTDLIISLAVPRFESLNYLQNLQFKKKNIKSEELPCRRRTQPNSIVLNSFIFISSL